MATIKNFNEETMQYEVNWDDGDPSGTVQSYQVSLYCIYLKTF